MTQIPPQTARSGRTESLSDSGRSTSEYLRHHTKLAGRSDQLFSDDAAELIHQAGRGFPRAVNRLAAAALLSTYTTHKTIADTTAVRAAITEVNDQ